MEKKIPTFLEIEKEIDGKGTIFRCGTPEGRDLEKKMMQRMQEMQSSAKQQPNPSRI